MARARQDSVDRHVARWSGLLEDMDPEVEGAVTRMQAITKRLKAADHASYAGTDDTIEDYRTLHALMIQPFPEEATPAQLADSCGVTRACRVCKASSVTFSPSVSILAYDNKPGGPSAPMKTTRPRARVPTVPLAAAVGEAGFPQRREMA